MPRALWLRQASGFMEMKEKTNVSKTDNAGIILFLFLSTKISEQSSNFYEFGYDFGLLIIGE